MHGGSGPVTSSSAEGRIEPVVQESTPGLIAARIREAIATGLIAPGAQISEAAYARQLNVSRGPLREGLQRLAQEGLLTAHRNRGLFVIEMTPENVVDMYIARAAVEEDVHVIGISVLSGAHNLLVPQVIDSLREQGLDPARVPVVVGGVIPDDDAVKLRELGVARVYTPKDHNVTVMLGEIADLVAAGTR